MSKDSVIQLDYQVNYSGLSISLNLWESEMYYAAIPVQQMVGNLVYYSNFGRYELRLAKSWKRISDNIWKIKLVNGAICENGETITAASFVKSLERSLYIMSAHGHTPVLKNLVGYEKFISENKKNNVFNLTSLEGLLAEDDQIVFTFDKPVRDGLLQILSFATYGYICAQNLNADGTWKNNRSFVSSGPYRLKEFLNENHIVLEKRNNWPNEFKKMSPDRVNYYQGIDHRNYDNNTVFSNATILDSFSPLKDINDKFRKYEVVQEYFKGIALGNLEKGFFKKLENRKTFKKKFLEFKNEIIERYPEIKFTNSLYPSQENISINSSTISEASAKLNWNTENPLIISGVEPKENTRNWLPWVVLKKTLNYYSLKYKFSDSSYSRDDITNNEYDLRIVGPSVGGGVEAWVLDVIFCSKLNASLPDPNGTICKLVHDYNNNKLSEDELIKLFLLTAEADSAILPFSQFGIQMYVSNKINIKSISPLMSVVRFDQIEIVNE